MARYISGPLAAQRGSEKQLRKDIGSLINKLAVLLEDEHLPICIARVAAEAPWHVLKPGHSDPSWTLESACSGG